ncbi:hypothetical protein [Stenotrophomonas sp. SY1]|uniref:hypothetical protein n=1 Tax=Stenotrophomonas sp. SY1 TaxID=477235 RepID=UPI001E390451|nr:hypothetical protein [Stenotrophomonas sp. SY1]MCD9087254.1 hypothetical protein [Stenotrophomonas sp. SY1]
MEKTQADAIARAMLEPRTEAREDIRRRRAAQAQWLHRKRQVAWFALAGTGVGAVAAYWLDQQLGGGLVYGALAGAAMGWGVLWLRGRSRTS